MPVVGNQSQFSGNTSGGAAQLSQAASSPYPPSSPPIPENPPWVQGVENGSFSNTHPPTGASTPGPTADFAPPAYQDPHGAPTALMGSISPATNLNPTAEAEQARVYEESISQFCATNRDLISPALEGKLRAARYLPKDNPSEVPAEYWRNAYGVEFFDLKRLQEAYER